MIETSNADHTQPGNSEHLRCLHSCELNRLEEVPVEIVQKIFLFVSFCLIIYTALHSGTVWTVFKLLSPSENRTVDSGSFIGTIPSKPNNTQSVASFSMAEHHDRAYSAERSEQQITCGA